MEARLVVGVGLVGAALGDDAAYGHGAVAQQAGHALQTGRFHLEVGDGASVVTEGLDFGVQVGILERQAHLASLRSIEAHSRYGIAETHVVARYLLYQTAVGIHYVRSGPGRIPIGVGAEFLLEFQVAYLVAVGIEVKDAVEADSLVGNNVIAYMQVFLQGAGCADAHYVERAVLGLDGARVEVDVGQGVKLGHHDLDVVGTDAVADAHYGLALVCAADGMELARLHVIIHCVEQRAYHSDAARVAHEDDVVAKLVGTKMDVERASVPVDDQFRRGYDSWCVHGFGH